MFHLNLRTPSRSKFPHSLMALCYSVTLWACKIYRQDLCAKPFKSLKRDKRSLSHSERANSKWTRRCSQTNRSVVICALSDTSRCSQAMVSPFKWIKKIMAVSSIVRWLTKFRVKFCDTPSKGTSSSLASSTQIRRADRCSQPVTLSSATGSLFHQVPPPLSSKKTAADNYKETTETNWLSLVPN